MSNITLTIPNDDHIALRAFGKALEEMALAHGAPLRVNPHVDVEKLRETMENAEPTYIVPEVDTTAQQVESLGATHIITEQKLVGDPVPVGDGNFSQGYVATVEEIADPVDSTGTPWDERIHSTSKALNADGTWRLRRKPKDMDEAQWAAFVESVKGELHTQTPVMTDEEVKTLEPVEIGEPTREEVDELIEASNKMLEPPVTPPGDDEQTVAGIPPLPVPQLGGSSGHSSQSTPYKLVGSGDDLSSGSGMGIPPLPVPPPVVVAPPVPEFDDGVPFPPSGTVSPALERMADHTTWDFPRLMTFLTERHGKIDVATVNTLLAQDGMSSVQELNAHPGKIGPFVARVKAHLGE